MRKILVVLIAALLVSCGIAFAEGGSCPIGEAKKGEVINRKCPVMGEKIDKDTPYKTEYQGKTIGFCCPDCIAKFNADPEKYMAKISKPCIIKCPKCGAEINVKEECKKQRGKDKKGGGTCPVDK